MVVAVMVLVPVVVEVSEVVVVVHEVGVVVHEVVVVVQEVVVVGRGPRGGFKNVIFLWLGGSPMCTNTKPQPTFRNSQPKASTSKALTIFFFSEEKKKTLLSKSNTKSVCSRKLAAISIPNDLLQIRTYPKISFIQDKRLTKKIQTQILKVKHDPSRQSSPPPDQYPWRV